MIFQAEKRMERKVSAIIPAIAPQISGITVNRVLDRPRSYKNPYDVLADCTLNSNGKRAILSSWASDACAVESMPALRKPRGAKHPIPFDEIMDALRQLDGMDPQVAAQPGDSVGTRHRRLGG
jgi:hypothetical protein